MELCGFEPQTPSMPLRCYATSKLLLHKDSEPWRLPLVPKLAPN
jgi:hypothetical protein